MRDLRTPHDGNHYPLGRQLLMYLAAAAVGLGMLAVLFLGLDAIKALADSFTANYPGAALFLKFVGVGYLIHLMRD
jgi:hypothetical protein